MRKTATALATAGLLVVAACAQQREEPVAGIGQTTTTTADRPSTTSTTAADGPSTTSTTAADGPSTTSTTAADGPSTTSTTAADGPSTTSTSTTTAPPGGSGDGRSGDEACAGGTPVWAGAPRGEPRAERALHVPAGDVGQVPDECVAPELGTGDVQVTLRWESSADLDLHVTEPDGTEVWYGDTGPTDTGGRLDVDSNIGCLDDGAVENVYWPEGRMPTGRYTVEVRGYQVDGCGHGRYTLTAKVEGSEVLRETGTVGEDETDTYRFEG